MDEYKVVSKFDRLVGGLLGGNNLHTKATTIKKVNPLGESETFIVQTVRVTEGEQVGDHVILEFLDSMQPVVRIILPPRVTNTMARHSASLGARARSNSSKAKMKQRMLAGYVPTPPKRQKS